MVIVGSWVGGVMCEGVVKAVWCRSCVAGSVGGECSLGCGVCACCQRLGGGACPWGGSAEGGGVVWAVGVGRGGVMARLRGGMRRGCVAIVWVACRRTGRR